MMASFRACFCLTALLVCAIPARSQTASGSPLPSGIQEHLGLAIPMRDRVHLAADLFLPSTNEKWPTILIRTPYNRKASTMLSYRYFVRRGYAVLIEDVRGRYASQGEFGSIAEEGPDGYDTISWIAHQPWSNGRVAMAGSSYLGMTEWWAAVENNPHLAAISPMCSGDDDYLDRFYSPGGALQIGHRLLWLAENLTPPSHVRPLFDSYVSHVPLLNADVSATGNVLPLWRQALSHPSYDLYWKDLSLRDRLPLLTTPVLSFGGWFDQYAESDLDAFSRLARHHQYLAPTRERSETEPASAPIEIQRTSAPPIETQRTSAPPIETWIGPWSHNPGSIFPTLDFGPQARLPIRAKQADWFDHWLKAPPLAASFEPTLHIFVMGLNLWREEHEWPLARTRYTPLYLASGGHANSAAGNGALEWQPVRKAPPDGFTYDPKNPVPTIGGAVCCEPAILPPGPLDQSAVETRPDVLVYTSPLLTAELEVTGPVRAVLYVSTSANDTDFTAKLLDVEPDGRPLILTDGIQRLRYRLSLNQPVFVKRNAVYQITIDAGVTSYVFLPGHRIRLEVSSSNFPRFDRNMNTSRPNADEFKSAKAKQSVFHERSYPSALILPMIPKSATRDRSAREGESRSRR